MKKRGCDARRVDEMEMEGEGAKERVLQSGRSGQEKKENEWSKGVERKGIGFGGS